MREVFTRLWMGNCWIMEGMRKLEPSGLERQIGVANIH